MWRILDPETIAMKKLFRRLHTALARDDLFVRLFCLLAGLLLIALGRAIWTVGHNLEAGALIFCWAITALFVLWGALSILRSVLSARSRMARFIDNLVPDPAMMDDAAPFFFVLCLPAVLLTQLTVPLVYGGNRFLVRHPDFR
jgi:hypothetical protein